MKRKLVITIKIVITVALLIFFALYLKDASDDLKKPEYDSSIPTSAKYAKIARFISPRAEFDIVIDVWRLKKSSPLRDTLNALIGRMDRGGGDNIMAELVEGLLSDRDVIGMLMFMGHLDIGGPYPLVAAVAQGAFDPKRFEESVRTILEDEDADLALENVGGRVAFLEMSGDDPMGFTFLDDEHLAVGTRSALAYLFGDVPTSTAMTDSMSDAVLFGRVNVGKRLKSIMPVDLGDISVVDFESGDGQAIKARISCPDSKQAEDLRMFAEGVRSLLMVQNASNMPLLDLIGGVNVYTSGNYVVMSTELYPFYKLFIEPKEEPDPAKLSLPFR